MNWIDPQDKLPPQGKKILWFSDGDCHVVQRFGKYWVPIPFVDSKHAHLNAPELWNDLYFPDPYKGLIQVSVENDDNLYTIDELEIFHNDVYRDMSNTILKDYRATRKK